MDDLDKQLAELQLLNSAELPPNPSGGGPAAPPVQSLGKKIAPVVPPKPRKPQQPLVPRSYSIERTLEPSYSSRLLLGNLYTNVGDAGGKGSGAQDLQPAEHYANVAQYSNLPPPPPGGFGNANLVPKGYNKKGSAAAEQVTYSNVQVGPLYGNLVPQHANLYANGEDLPPPPPPNLTDYSAPCAAAGAFPPPPPEEFPPPPSPVSSSYSELRRATRPARDYRAGGPSAPPGAPGAPGGAGGARSPSSAYESIYEPINPRPASQMSSRSAYSLYAPYAGSRASSGPSRSASRVGAGAPAAGGPAGAGPAGGEREVDALTDLLVRGMGGAGPEGELEDEEDGGEFYGICVKCREKVIGENNGCTAMDKIYHTKCFTCHACAVNLQGKPFYALRGKPYCKEDYMNTLEKCSVCTKPILDRILRATGKPYHPKCFCCVICGKSLDGIPFTVDATNRIHCIEDFHKKFAPKCCVCALPIMPELGQEETVRVVALDRSFHIQCYKCEDCGLVLSSEAEGRGCYPLDDHVLCKSCNAKRVQALTNNITTEL